MVWFAARNGSALPLRLSMIVAVVGRGRVVRRRMDEESMLAHNHRWDLMFHHVGVSWNIREML